MSRAYGVATHILHCAYLSDKRSLVYCGTYRTQVVMQTHSLYLARNSIQLETVILRYTYRADSHLLLGLVYKLVVAVETCDELI